MPTTYFLITIHYRLYHLELYQFQINEPKKCLPVISILNYINIILPIIAAEYQYGGECTEICLCSLKINVFCKSPHYINFYLYINHFFFHISWYNREWIVFCGIPFSLVLIFLVYGKFSVIRSSLMFPPQVVGVVFIFSNFGSFVRYVYMKGFFSSHK